MCLVNKVHLPMFLFIYLFLFYSANIITKSYKTIRSGFKLVRLAPKKRIHDNNNLFWYKTSYSSVRPIWSAQNLQEIFSIKKNTQTYIEDWTLPPILNLQKNLTTLLEAPYFICFKCSVEWLQFNTWKEKNISFDVCRSNKNL